MERLQRKISLLVAVGYSLAQVPDYVDTEHLVNNSQGLTTSTQLSYGAVSLVNGI